MKRKNKNAFVRYLPMLIAAIVGAAGGYLYYRFVGCVSGSCAITSNPYISTLFGAVIGGLIGGIITPGEKRPGEQKDGGESGR